MSIQLRFVHVIWACDGSNYNKLIHLLVFVEIEYCRFGNANILSRDFFFYNISKISFELDRCLASYLKDVSVFQALGRGMSNNGVIIVEVEKFF